MAFKIHPQWWPLLAIASPVLAPMMAARNRRFKRNREKANEVNLERISKAKPLDLPELEYLDLTVLSEWAAEDDFMGEPGVSYLFRTDRGSLLYDVSFGPSHSTLLHNAAKLGVGLDQVDALAISHLHMDHMGGMKAQRARQVMVPEELGAPAGTIFSGCGHPTIEVILEMVRHLSGEPVYAIGGGLHFPVTSGRGRYKGIQAQMLFGTGKPPWQRISDDDLSRTIGSINAAGPKKVFLSAHDTCDYALKRFEDELKAETYVLRAGASYRL